MLDPQSLLHLNGTELDYKDKLMQSGFVSNNPNAVKYLIKLPQADKLETAQTAARDALSKEKVSSWELERLGTALSIGDNPLPLGMALKISSH